LDFASGGGGSYLSEAHVQGIGTNDSDGLGSSVPEPATGSGLMLGPIGLACSTGSRQRRMRIGERGSFCS
jgi:hypothetical protein